MSNNTLFILLLLVLTAMACNPDDSMSNGEDAMNGGGGMIVIDDLPLTDCIDALDDWTISDSEFPNLQRQVDLFFVNENIGYSVGRTGTITKTMDGGESWEILEYYFQFSSGANPNPLTNAHFNACYFLNENVGFVAGWGEENLSDPSNPSDALFLKTLDGGETWEKTFADNLRLISDVHFFDEQIGLVYGRTFDDENHVFRTTDGGDSWQNINLPITKIVDASFSSRGNELLLLVSDELDKGHLFASNDMGGNWSTKEFPVDRLKELYYLDDQIGFLSDAKDIYRTLDAGLTWTNITLGLDFYSHFHFRNANEGFVFVPYYSALQGGGETHFIVDGYHVFQTDDAGETWSQKNVAAECDFSGIRSFASPDVSFTLSNTSSVVRYAFE